MVGLKGTVAEAMEKIYEIIFTAQSRTTHYAFESKEERDTFSSALFGVKSFSESTVVEKDCGFLFNHFIGKDNFINDAMKMLNGDLVTWYLDAEGRLSVIDKNHVEYNLGKPDFFDTDHEYYNYVDRFTMEAFCNGWYSITVECMLPDEDGEEN